MWMEAYVQEIWIREHLANADRIAANGYRLRPPTPRPRRALGRRALQAMLHSTVIPRMARRVVRMALP
jgi:hypothetical protein